MSILTTLVSFYRCRCSCLLPVLDIHAHHTVTLSYNFGVSMLQMSVVSFLLHSSLPSKHCLPSTLSPLTFISEFHCCHCQILHSSFIPYNRHPFQTTAFKGNKFSTKLITNPDQSKSRTHCTQVTYDNSANNQTSIHSERLCRSQFKRLKHSLQGMRKKEQL